jgi:adenylate cyclase
VERTECLTEPTGVRENVAERVRRLAAIMFTDLVGFTRLGQEDEEEALRLRAEHQSLLRPIFVAHHGREVKSLGDGFLVEFPSAMESVRCAVEIQQALARRNADPSARGRILLRIGIHVGDVVGDGDDIVGDAVNVASRIEPLADPGGVSVSGSVFDQVRNKIRLPLEKIGSRTLKNVEYPVDVYRVLLWADTDRPRGPVPEADPNVRLAVLPLANMSPDAGDAYFADGLTDELITQTAKIPGLRVVPRTSVLRYKDSTSPLRDVARDLGVRLALEGSVRKSGNRVRITVQLFDPNSEAQLWSSRYDRPFEDIFAIQDDIAGQVASSISVHLSKQAKSGPPAYAPGPRETDDMEAYSLFLHGRKLFGEKGSEETIRQALGFFEEAVARDPRFARAHLGVADAVLWLGGEGAVDHEKALERGRNEIATALALNESLAEAHSSLASLSLTTDDFPTCAREARRAIELNPSLADPYRWLAQLAAGGGQIDEAVRLLESARAIDPLDINVLAFLGRAYAYAGRTQDAFAHWEQTKALVAFRTNANLTEFYLGHGELEKAKGTLREMERIRPTSPWNEAYRGILAAKEGDTVAARREIERLEARTEAKAVAFFLVGFIQFALGDRDGFFRSMDRARTEGSDPVLELMYSSLFDSARDDPKFRDYIERFVRRPTPR